MYEYSRRSPYRAMNSSRSAVVRARQCGPRLRAEISARSLGPHWRARTTAEREEFIALYGDLLEYSYISKIEMYSGETIRYLGEAVDGQQAGGKTRDGVNAGDGMP